MSFRVRPAGAQDFPAIYEMAKLTGGGFTNLPADRVRMGLRVAAVWRDRQEWTTSPENIAHFRPTGEPDAPYDSFKDHL